VANAILDGTDAVMLSNETATGRFPVEAVQMMRQIGEITETAFPYDEWRNRRQAVTKKLQSVTEAISAASCSVAENLQAKAIVSTTMSGYSARQVARHRPPTAVMAVSPLASTQRRLALVWGVDCVLVPDFYDTDGMLLQTAETMRKFGLIKGDRLVITAGVPFGESGQTNLIQVHEIG
jgi:pyruvate kinase